MEPDTQQTDARGAALVPLETALRLFVALVAFLLMAITCIDVAGRYGFNAPLPGAAELSELALGLLVFGALPLVTARREHVTVDLLELAFGSRLQQLQRLVALVTSLVALALMTWQLWVRAGKLAQYADTSSYLGIPLAPVAWFMSAMAGLATAVVALQLVAWLRRLGRRA